MKHGRREGWREEGTKERRKGKESAGKKRNKTKHSSHHTIALHVDTDEMPVNSSSVVLETTTTLGTGSFSEKALTILFF